ncbi:transglutaminase family protein [Parvularcula flava]|uniref:Transglutaminase n=1 Tax=Aquisalinus luteolus TaxID=1566827 RepID=A0A8J3A4G6_9PROT|nr:transglutaminase family protein [Aquisalinus luteolus]NHK29653.1 transglutaminase family protein [Aquisalinus luteolus]GGI02204.1 transglutaminase [Aquisalinus luteolus]
MLYDIRLKLSYRYQGLVGGSRHQLRVAPPSIEGVQRVFSQSLSIDPWPTEQSGFTDFFGNAVTAFANRDPHDRLDVTMETRVEVTRPEPSLDVSADLDGLAADIAASHSLAPQSPHHFLHQGNYTPQTEEMTAYARECTQDSPSVLALADRLCRRIKDEFHYDGTATTVTTTAAEAFAGKSGVCQDFSHVMIAALLGLGVPAGYVSGCLRTEPPEGEERLEGADAMHAWVKVWCGRESGWQEFDPTNGIPASSDHITIGHGRDYADVTPILGMLKTAGEQSAAQAVDVIPVKSS